MVEQYSPQTNEKCYSVLQCPMRLFLLLFQGSKHSLSAQALLGFAAVWVRTLEGAAAEAALLWTCPDPGEDDGRDEAEE